MLLIIHPEYSL